MSKAVALLLFALLMLSSFAIVGCAFAQSIPKPSLPEFTMKYVDYSYDIPPTYEIDQFTGQNVTKQEGEHIDNRTAVFTIRNQPFTNYVDSNNNTIGLHYNFRYKGHFGSDWGYFPFSESGQSWRYHSTFFVFIDVPPDEFSSASNSEYTEILLRLPFLFGYGNPPMNTQVDFQLQALIGHIDYEGDGYYRFTGERSDWSETQTITIVESQTSSPEPTIPTSPTPSPEPTSSPYSEPQVTGQELILGIAVTVAVLGTGLGLLLYLIKRK
jgi:hypothetical protein